MKLGYLKKLFCKCDLKKNVDSLILILEVKKEVLKSVVTLIKVKCEKVDYNAEVDTEKYDNRPDIECIWFHQILFKKEDKKLLELFDQLSHEINEIKEELGEGITDYIDPLKKFYPWSNK